MDSLFVYVEVDLELCNEIAFLWTVAKWRLHTRQPVRFYLLTSCCDMITPTKCSFELVVAHVLVPRRVRRCANFEYATKDDLCKTSELSLTCRLFFCFFKITWWNSLGGRLNARLFLIAVVELIIFFLLLHSLLHALCVDAGIVVPRDMLQTTILYWKFWVNSSKAVLTYGYYSVLCLALCLVV